MTLDEFLALLETADDRITRQNARELLDAADDIVPIVQSQMHRQTGNMIESTGRFGPYPAGSGVLEATIESGAWYAGFEAARGGEHDWPTRSVEAAQPRVQELSEALAEAVARILVGT